MASKIPVIDLKDFPGETAKLIEACEEWGCFRIVNYEGILSESVMQEMKEVVKSLLELPAAIKMRNRDVIAGSGYMAPSTINPLYEALGLYDASSSQAVDAFCSNLDVSEMQRAVILNYAKAVNELMMYIGSKIGEGLGIKGYSFDDWCCQFRINKYNFTPETVTSPGVQLHTDSSFLTLLHDDKNIGGLQVMKRSGEFEAVDPCPRTLVVNLGDIAPVWSNGRFLNVKHRVMCKEAGTRLSIASFLLGPRAGMVESPPELVDSEHPRLFSPFTYQDYRSLRMSKNLHTGGTVDCFRIHEDSAKDCK
ncbi:2-oxoglutarate and oxygenase superfamily protein [Perilla frutescens var. hirtella]|uniref:2-oxoglutarate-dependent dioxygenase DAO n=1 Tax=Perilla frutescens var. hirtella TaxID=608512 RepID=A0AAD4J469_PERFH|nr:2-oxoglutarate and oxygenase superfamily protein [Perilla frutescens var. hirtella]